MDKDKKSIGGYTSAFHPASSGRLGRKDAYSMDELISSYIKEMKLVNGLNRQRIFEAWDQVSGAGKYTVGRYIRGGVLYCSISSSVVRSRLYFQRARIKDLINEFLRNDELFVKDTGKDEYVKDIVLR